MKKYLLLYIIFILPFLGAAQSLSIEELWQKAEWSRTSAEQETKIAIQQREIDIIKANRLPIFYADANLQRNLIIPTTPVPAIAFDPNAQDGAIIPLQFATKWSSKTGVQLEWNFFDPNRKNDITQQEINLKKSEIEKNETLVGWKINATLAYASIVLSTKQLEMARQDSIAYAAILQISKDRYDAGRISSAEYILAQQEMERKRIHIYEAWTVLQEASLELQKYLNEEISTVNSSINDILTHLAKHHVESFEIQKLLLDNQLSELNITQLKNQRLPSLSLNGYYGYQFFDNRLDITNKDQWYGNSYANIALRIPISDYIWKNSALKKATLESKLSAIQLENKRLEDNIEAKQNERKILSTQQKINRLKEIEKLALQNKTEQFKIYKAGRMLLSDFNEVIIAHNKAQQDIWQSEYDLIGIILE